MRPDPQQHRDRDESGRIIYLGDVRRRRGKRHQVPDQQYLILVALAALLGWALWLAVLFTVNPSKLLSYIAFFAPLCLALTGTGTLAVYAFEWRRGVMPNLAECGRRAILGTAVVVGNLALLAAQHWGILAGGISIVAAVGIDLAFAHRAAR